MADTAFEGWAVVELMGHRRLAGLVSEQQIAGAAFLRLDVHGAEAEVVTQFYAPAAVYCITPTTEEIARKLGDKARPQPVTRYELEPRRAEYADEDDPF
jgi:hypothetical protein